LSGDVLDKLASIPPRDMRKLLLDALGTAKLAGRDHLLPEDVDSRKLCGRRARLGF
jgi:ATP-dependent Lon protease